MGNRHSHVGILWEIVILTCGNLMGNCYSQLGMLWEIVIPTCGNLMGIPTGLSIAFPQIPIDDYILIKHQRALLARSLRGRTQPHTNREAVGVWFIYF